MSKKKDLEIGDKVYVTTFVSAYEGVLKAETDKGKYIVEINGQLFTLFRDSVVKKPEDKPDVR